MARYLDSEQIGIRCSIVRGGTSKGVFFFDHDVPPPGAARDALLKRVMGTPDVMQIDGLGGTHIVTSKIAIVGRSDREDADVDYTFAQVEMARDVIDYAGNCGNISAGVGPFSVDAGLVRPDPGSDTTLVRIFNTNTRKVLRAHVPVHNGRAKVKGNVAIAGVPGTGAGVFMDYSATGGGLTGRTLPTGNRRDEIALEDGRKVEVTICDFSNPYVFVRASDVGATGDEHPDAICHDKALLDRCREIRGKAAQLAGMVSDWRKVDDEQALFPILTYIAGPGDYANMRGETMAAGSMDLKLRMICMNTCHHSVAGTGSMCTSAASRIPGSVVNRIVGEAAAARDDLRIAHPLGVTTVGVVSKPANNEMGVEFERLGFMRTARKIMDGTVYVPTSAAY
ncbi:MAG: 2-methylaconitate cis-trans isomerase PrpF family protein [Alphaproteobacteria bacterium]